MRLRRKLASGLILAAIVPVAISQQASQAQIATFYSQAELVQVPVLVVRKGQHITGLKAESFTIFEDGKKQRIARFEEISGSTVQVNWEKPIPGLYTNNPWRNQSPAHLTVLLFDLINTPHLKQEFVRSALMKFLSAIPEGSDPIMLAALTPKGLEIIHHFTTNPAILRSSVEKMKSTLSENEHPRRLQEEKQEATIAALNVIGSKNNGHADIDDPEVQRLADLFQSESDAYVQYREMDRNEMSLLQIQRLARSLAGVPGRKSLIWATGGISFTEGSQPLGGFTPPSRMIGRIRAMGASQTNIAENNDFFDRTWEVLSDASIAVYTIDMEELTNPAFTEANAMLSTVGSMRDKQGFGLRAQAMNGFTDKTGGRYCMLDQKLENCFRNAINDSSSYYMLAYYPAPNGKTGWRKLKVEVAGEGISVHTRSGYYSRTRGEISKLRQDEIAEALISPLDATAIPIAVRWMNEPAPDSSANPKRTFELFIDSRTVAVDSSKQNQFHLSVIVAAHTNKNQYNGKIAKTFSGHVPQSQVADPNEKPILFRDTLELSPAENEVRFIVRDELSGHIGSVTTRIEE